MASNESRVVINVVVRDRASGQLLSAQRLDSNTYLAPSGHDSRAIARAVAGQDARYAYHGAVVHPATEQAT
jgi:hypothetical protein